MMQLALMSLTSVLSTVVSLLPALHWHPPTPFNFYTFLSFLQIYTLYISSYIEIYIKKTYMSYILYA